MTSFDLGAYLGRIGMSGAPACNAEGLAAIVDAQLRTVPFENLDIMLRRPIALSPDGLAAKLVSRRRGGYCFELNSLLGLALSALGFEQRPLLARVRLGRPRDQPTPKTHQLQLVQLEGAPWVADAGFGLGLPSAPLPLVEGEREQQGVRLRLERGRDAVGHEQWTLQQRASEDWTDVYQFDLGTVLPIDIELANHFTATYPKSPFVRGPTLGLLRETGRISVMGGRGSIARPDGPQPLDVPSREGRVAWLREHFGIELDASDDELPPWTPPSD
jgi:N-hydroxyarylamine O-acetyltransferase